MSKKVEALVELQERIKDEERETGYFEKALELLSGDYRVSIGSEWVSESVKSTFRIAVERELLERRHYVARLKDQLEGMLK